MDDLQAIREALLHVAVIFSFVTAVLVMALTDAAITILLFKLSGKIKRASQLDQPEVPLPKLPPDHQVVVLGGGVKRWD